MSSFQTAFWKLTTLTGVIAAGCFVVLQVQESLGDIASPATAEASVSAFDEAGSPFASGDLGKRPLDVESIESDAVGGDDPFYANVPERTNLAGSHFAEAECCEGRGCEAGANVGPAA